ncbi:MAG: YdeI/OmpD-associated family protein [Pseudonocardia sp.]|nr:YdeI/OmpD-associated family protein [Pseudonocardia sp.]
MRESAERFQPGCLHEWRAWLAEHHARGEGVWLVTWRAGSGGPRITYEESVEQALCFGWVDSTGNKLDDQRTMLWFAPRKARSGWARTNKVRIERLTAEGLMAPAGLAVIEAAKADGSWTLLDDVENLVVPPDLAAAFTPAGRANWDAFPRSARRGILEWIVQAKRPETRAKRIAETAGKAEVNERAYQWKPKT